MTFGEVLKKLRTDKGITQEKLAFDLDIPESTIRRLETSSGIPRKDRLMQIAKYFDVSTDYLLSYKDDPYAKDEELDPDIQFIMRAREEMSPKAYARFISLAKKMKESFEEEDDET